MSTTAKPLSACTSQPPPGVIGTELTAIPPTGGLWWPVLLIPAITIVLYLSAGWNNGFVNWDDTKYIRDNPLLRSPDGLRDIWLTLKTPQYYPLTFSGYWLEYQLWGPWTRGYLIINVLLHAMNSLLVFRVVRMMGASRGIAWFVAVVFALHPLQVASVAWLAQLKNVLSGFFALATVILYHRQSRSRQLGDFIVMIIAFALAALAKTSVVALPLVLLVLDVRVWGATLRQGLIRIVPLLMIGAALGCVTIAAEIRISPQSGSMTNALEAFPRLLIHAGHAFWPNPLIAIYPKTAGAATYLIGGLGLALALFAASHGSSPRSAPRLLIPAVAWFVALHLPTLGLISFGHLAYADVADHFAYLPLIGLAILVAIAGQLAIEGTFRSAAQPATVALSLLIAGTLTVISANQIPRWHDGVTYWTHTINHNPGSALAFNNLGVAFSERGEMEQALARFRAAAQLDPDFAGARNNVGHALRALGRTQQAITWFRDEIAKHPDDRVARATLALILAEAKRMDDAVIAWEQYTRDFPDDADGFFNYANSLRERGDIAGALRRYDDALRILPNHIPALVNAATARMELGENEEAISLLRNATAIAPGDFNAQYTLGLALANVGKLDDSIAALERAATIDPNSSEVFSHAGLIFLAKGERNDAVRNFKQALALNPRDSQASFSLGTLAIGAKRYADAAEYFRKSAELNPREAAAWIGLADALMNLNQPIEAHAAAAQALTIAREEKNENLIRELEARIATPTTQFRSPDSAK